MDARDRWVTRSIPTLAAAAILGAIGAVLVAHALGTKAVLPRTRLGGLALLVSAGVLALDPGRMWRDLVGSLRAAIRPRERWHLLALAAIVLLGLAVRLEFLGLAMRYDESVTFLTFASQHLSVALASYPFPNNHFLNTLLIHFAWRAFGNHPEVIRLPALVAGVALVPAMYVAGRMLYDQTVGLVAAALTVPSGVLIEYSVNARGYTLVSLATVVLIPLGLYALTRRSGAAWVLWATVAALGLWSVPTMVYGLAIVAFWILLVALLDVPRAGRLLAVVSLENALLVTAGIAWVLYQPAWGQYGFNYNEATVPPGFVEHVWNAFGLGYGPLRWLFAAAALAAVALHRQVARTRAPLWLAIAVVVPVSITVSHRVPPFVRTWLFLLPLLLLLAAAGLTGLTRLALRTWPRGRIRVVGVALPVLLAGALVLAFRDSDLYTVDDPPTKGADQAVTYLVAHWHQGQDGLAIGRFAAPAFQYYFLRHGIEPSAAVGPVLGVAPAQPGHPTYLTILEARPPTTLAEAVASYPPLLGSRLVERVPGGVVYRSPPT